MGGVIKFNKKSFQKGQVKWWTTSGSGADLEKSSRKCVKPQTPSTGKRSEKTGPAWM